MIFPRKLSTNSSIGVTAVSMGCIDETDILRLENAHKKLRERGFNTIETKNCDCDCWYDWNQTYDCGN